MVVRPGREDGRSLAGGPPADSPSLKIQKPVAEVFDAVVNPKRLSGYFVQEASGPLKEGATVQWKFAATSAL